MVAVAHINLHPEMEEEYQRKGRPLGITRGEYRVWHLLSHGYTNATIAQITCMQLKRVENYINSVYYHLHVAGDKQLNPRVQATLKFWDINGESR